LGPVVLLGDEIPIPAEDRVGAGDGGDFAQGLAAERLGESGEAASLGVRQPDAPAESVAEEAVLLPQILDRPFLLAGDPGPIQAAANWIGKGRVVITKADPKYALVARSSSR
jgi:hypothetical protein